MSTQEDTYSLEQLLQKLTSIDESSKKSVFECLQLITSDFNEILAEDLLEVVSIVTNCIIELQLFVYETNSVATKNDVDLVKENLQIAQSLITVEEEILSIVCLGENYQLKEFHSIFIHIPNSIYHTFKHCKESQKVYQICLANCDEILELYNRTQSIYLKYVDLVNKLCGSINQADAEVLSNALRGMSKVCEILVDINVKSLTEGWRNFCKIIEDYKAILTVCSYSCTQEIDLIINQVEQLMNLVLGGIDCKVAAQKVNLSGFLIKVGLKIIQAFWEVLSVNNQECLIVFFSNIVCYDSNYLYFRKCPQEVVTLVEKCFFVPVEDVLSSHLFELCLFTKDHYTERLNIYGYLNLAVIALEQLLEENQSIKERFNFDAFVEEILKYSKACFPEFFWHSFRSDETHHLFDRLVLAVAANILTTEHFYTSGVIQALINNTSSGSIWCHFICTEVLFLLLRNSNSNTRLLIILTLVENYVQKSTLKFGRFPQLVYHHQFLKSCYDSLPLQDKMEVMRQYQPYKFISVWKLFGLQDVEGPEIQRMIVRIKDLKNLADDNSCEDFINLLDYLEAVSTKNLENVSIEDELDSVIVELWKFKGQVDYNSTFFKYFMERLSRISLNRLRYFNAPLLLSIVDHLTVLCTYRSFAVLIAQLLNSLTFQNIWCNKEEEIIFQRVVKIFETLLKSKDDVTIELFLDILRATRHKTDYEMARVLNSRFNSVQIYSIKDFEVTIIDRYLEAAKCIRFNHVCLDWSSPTSLIKTEKKPQAVIMNKPKILTTSNEEIPRIKRLKTEEGEEVDDINEVLSRLKGEVKCLKKMLLKGKLTPKNAQELKMISSQLQMML